MLLVHITNTKSQRNCPILHPLSSSSPNMSMKYPSNYNATAITISSCSNYAIVGANGGTLCKYNISSGLLKCTYPKNKYPKH